MNRVIVYNSTWTFTSSMKCCSIAQFHQHVSRNVKRAQKIRSVILRSECIIQRQTLQSNANALNVTAPGISASRLRRKTTPSQWSRPFTSCTTTASSAAGNNSLTIKIEKDAGSNGVVALDPLLIRDSCRCHLCVDPASQQKLFKTADIPSEIAGRIVDEHSSNDSGDGSSPINDDNKAIATISWIHDIPGYPPEHRTELTASMIAAMAEWNLKGIPPLASVSSKWKPKRADAASTPADSPSRRNMNPKDSRSAWNAAEMVRRVQWFEYDTYMRSDKTLFAALEALRVYGLVFLRGVPDSVSTGTEKPGEDVTVENIAERIGPLRSSFYGRSWDVRSVPGATNVAYTHRYLGLHMDLLYVAWQDPFGHCR